MSDRLSVQATARHAHDGQLTSMNRRSSSARNTLNCCKPRRRGWSHHTNVAIVNCYRSI